MPEGGGPESATGCRTLVGHAQRWRMYGVQTYQALITNTRYQGPVPSPKPLPQDFRYTSGGEPARHEKVGHRCQAAGVRHGLHDLRCQPSRLPATVWFLALHWLTQVQQSVLPLEPECQVGGNQNRTLEGSAQARLKQNCPSRVPEKSRAPSNRDGRRWGFNWARAEARPQRHPARGGRMWMLVLRSAPANRNLASEGWPTRAQSRLGTNASMNDCRTTAAIPILLPVFSLE